MLKSSSAKRLGCVKAEDGGEDTIEEGGGCDSGGGGLSALGGSGGGSDKVDALRIAREDFLKRHISGFQETADKTVPDSASVKVISSWDCSTVGNVSVQTGFQGRLRGCHHVDVTGTVQETPGKNVAAHGQ